MALDRVIQKRYGKRCPHVHVSGRRCHERIGSNQQTCGIHKGTACTECDSMKSAFTPPKGWRD